MTTRTTRTDACKCCGEAAVAFGVCQNCFDALDFSWFGYRVICREHDNRVRL